MKILCYFLCLLFLAFVQANDDFNCKDECGLYSAGDVTMENVLAECKAYDAATTCDEKNIRLEKLKIKTRKKGGTRIVGGDAVKLPLPWIVHILFRTEGCGGSLINSRFVLTAAHCACGVGGHEFFCTREIVEVEKGVPILFKDMKVALENIKLFIGATAANKKTGLPWTSAELRDLNPQEGGGLIYKPDMMWIHPDLSTSKEFAMSPDILLIRLEKAVASFTDSVRPVCLAPPDFIDYPPCADNSVDRVSRGMEKGEVRGKMMGGCGLVAGWGARFDGDAYADVCITAPSREFPGRSKKCASVWTVQGRKVMECSRSAPLPTDFDTPCQEFIQESNFRNAVNDPSSPWPYGDFNKIASSGSVKIIELKRGSNNTYVCSTTDIQAVERVYKAENPSPESTFPGWCATETSPLSGKIIEMGLCEENCLSDETGINFATQNLLTVDECEYLFKNSQLDFKPELEMCGGKKTLLPPVQNEFIRIRKSKAERDLDQQLFTKIGDKDSEKILPSKFKFLFQGPKRDLSSGLPEDYPYNWYLGGRDTCQGDSGGPMVRNIPGNGRVRATQLGVVSRGAGCASFNAPGIYTRVVSVYDWLKKTISENSGGTKMCFK